jgi:hypothetical protein
MQARREVIQNHENENVLNIGQGEARHRKYRVIQNEWYKKKT